MNTIQLKIEYFKRKYNFLYQGKIHSEDDFCIDVGDMFVLKFHPQSKSLYFFHYDNFYHSSIYNTIKEIDTHQFKKFLQLGREIETCQSCFDKKFEFCICKD